MRYRDQPTVEVEIKVPAPPDAVWPVVTDIALPVDLPGELGAPPGSTAPVGLGRSRR